MKRIRLEIPLGDGDVYLPWKVWLKVNDNNTEAFSDRNFTNPIRDTRKKVSLDIDVPDKLQSIEIGGLGGLVPVENIVVDWGRLKAGNSRVPGLKSVIVIFDDRTHEVPVVDEKPDIKEWIYYKDHEMDGWLFLKRWALVVYTFETQTIASFYWHSKLITEGKQ